MIPALNHVYLNSPILDQKWERKYVLNGLCKGLPVQKWDVPALYFCDVEHDSYILVGVIPFILV